MIKCGSHVYIGVCLSHGWAGWLVKFVVLKKISLKLFKTIPCWVFESSVEVTAFLLGQALLCNRCYPDVSWGHSGLRILVPASLPQPQEAQGSPWEACVPRACVLMLFLGLSSCPLNPHSHPPSWASPSLCPPPHVILAHYPIAHRLPTRCGRSLNTLPFWWF